MARDDVSGVEAPVTVRTLRASGRQPQFILIGDRESIPGEPHAAGLADAYKLKHVLHTNLTWPAYYGLIREALIGCAKGEVFDSLTPETADALAHLIAELDKELAPPKSVEPITKEEIRDTLGWDSVPGQDGYNANALIPGATPAVLDPRD